MTDQTDEVESSLLAKLIGSLTALRPQSMRVASCTTESQVLNSVQTELHVGTTSVPLVRILSEPEIVPEIDRGSTGAATPLIDCCLSPARFAEEDSACQARTTLCRSWWSV